jgi:hypothetical protein
MTQAEQCRLIQPWDERRYYHDMLGYNFRLSDRMPPSAGSNGSISNSRRSEINAEYLNNFILWLRPS